MTTETSSSAGATPGTGSPVTGTPASSGATPQTPTLTLEEAQKRIADLEHSQRNAGEELERHRKNAKKLAEYETAEAARQAASLSDLEKAQSRADKAEKQIQTYKQQLVNAQVKLAAKDKGIIDPDIAALALQDKLEFGDDGMPTNLDKALDELIKSKPYLVPVAGQATPGSAAQTNTPAVPAMNPGRSQIASTGTLPAGRKVTFHDLDWKR